MIQEVGSAPASKAAKLGQLKEIARSFEAIFMQMMMKGMRSAVPKSGFMSGGNAEAIFTDLFDSQVTERASGRGRGMGIANMILKEYSKHVRSDSGAAVDRKG